MVDGNDGLNSCVQLQNYGKRAFWPAMFLVAALVLPPICSADKASEQALADTPAAGQTTIRGILEGSGGRFVRFSPDGTLILSVGDDSARVWDSTTRTPITPPLPYRGDFVSAGFIDDGRAVYLADDVSFRLWDSHTGKDLGRPITPNRTVRFATPSPDGSNVAFIWAADSATSLPMIDIYDTKTGELRLSIKHPDLPRYTAFSPDGHRVLSVGFVVPDKRKFHVWNADTGRELFPAIESLSNDDCRPGRSCAPAAFSPDGGRLAITCGNWYQVLNARTGKRIAGKPPEYYAGSPGTYVVWLRFVNDGNGVVVVQDHRAGLSDASTTKVYVDNPRVTAVEGSVATDGKKLVCEYITEGEAPHYALGCWDLVSGKQAQQIGDEQDAGLLDLSANGRYVAVTGSQRHPAGTVIWEISTSGSR